MKRKTLLIVLPILALLIVLAGTALAGPPSDRNYLAMLNGDNAGVQTDASGIAIFHFTPRGTRLGYRLVVNNIENVTMAHIHLADEPGGNGPPVLWLYPDAPPPQLIDGEFSGVLAERVVSADDLVGPLVGMTLNDLRQAFEEGLAYVNVHTMQHPAGEIRGDIGNIGSDQ